MNKVIVKVVVPPDMTRHIAYCAKNAELGGKSHIRKTDDRQNNLGTDQLVGQLGEYVGTTHLFRDHNIYFARRYAIDKNPILGDDGADMPGLNIDFKTSLIRNQSKPLETYNLIVRPKERHKDNIYVLILVQPNADVGLDITQPIDVFLVGWCTDQELPPVDTFGIFEGAHCVRGSFLQNIMPFTTYDARRTS